MNRQWIRGRTVESLAAIALAMVALAGCGAPGMAPGNVSGNGGSEPGAVAAAAAALRPSLAVRLDGEYGLWARHAGDSILISWVAREPGPGFLRAVGEAGLRHEVATAAASVHTAAFPAPGSGVITLDYGAVGDAGDRHRTTLYLGGEVRRAPVVAAGVDSLFVVADVHGEYDDLVRLLRNAGVIDQARRWSAGNAHLAMLGDYFSRGADVTKLLWFLYELERQAERQGGRVHMLLGNHEVMSVTGDLRYISPKEALLAELHGVDYPRLYDLDSSILGRWLASKPGIIRIDRVLLAHGGVFTDYLDYTVPAYDDTLATYMGEEVFQRWFDTTFVAPVDSAGLVRREEFFWGSNSVFWFRGYVQSDTLGDALRTVLRRFDSDLLVVGHTPIERIENRYGGALIAAHPRRAATEALLLVRDGEGYRRYRYGLSGPPEPLPAAPEP